MTPNPDTRTARLRFDLSMELPGPSQGDAIEFVEALGVNPWSFATIEPVGEVVVGNQATGTFEAVGTPGQVFELAGAILQLPP
jgi:hypothetical protein